MAAQGLVRVRVFVSFFLLVCISSGLLISAVCSSEPRNGNNADFEADDNLKMVTALLAPPAQTSFYYILALQWPPSQCSAKQCKKDMKTAPTIFTIHGLWPNWDTGNSPQYCFPDNKFDFAQVLPIAKNLDIAWPSLFDTRTQQSFLGNEWAKHGTSSSLSQFNYFNTALKLVAESTEVNVYNRLKAIGVTPDPKKKYSPSKIITDYQAKWKQSIKIICVQDRNSPDQMVGEIYFKVNKDGKTVESIGDRDKTKGCTQSMVLFPDKKVI